MRVADLTTSRELLWNLTLRELRSKYKRSVLGWTWSMLNPLATMLIYTFVFGVVLRTKPQAAMANGGHVFAFFLLCALLPWNFFSMTSTMSMSALLANAGLVKKVWFPREILIFANVGSLLVSFAIEMALLSVALVIAGNMVIVWLPLVILLMLLLAVLATGFGLLLAALNVYFRDLGYLWGIIVQLWFFATPIVYPPELVQKRIGGLVLRLYEANPMAVFGRCFRDVMYELRWPTAFQLGYLTVVSVAVLAFGLWVFNRLSVRFAEEL